MWSNLQAALACVLAWAEMGSAASSTMDLTFSQQVLAEQQLLMSELSSRHGRQLLSSKVGSVGVGVFLILLFMGICLLICLLGSRTKMRWVFYFMSAAMFAIVFGVLAGSPKGDPPAKPATGYDQTIVPLAIVMSLLCLGTVMGGLGMLVFQAAPRVYARPLSYHEDVLRGGM